MKKITLKDFTPDNIPTQKQVESLAQFIIENFENEIGESEDHNGEGAIEMAVRLLLEYKSLREMNTTTKEIKEFRKDCEKEIGYISSLFMLQENVMPSWHNSIPSERLLESMDRIESYLFKVIKIGRAHV